MTSVLFEQPYNETLVHQLIVRELAAARSGNSAQKTRSEVRGGGRKPWRQKGTGRARAGTIRSPIWRGGGVTFASKKRSYQQKLNKKMYRAAMLSLLSELNRRGAIKIVDGIACDAIKTKALVETLNKLEIANALIVTDQLDKNLYLSARNIPLVEVIDAQAVNPVSLLRYDQVVITKTALQQLEERFK